MTQDLGCTGANNVCVYPSGLIVFTNKGFYRVGHDLSFADPNNYIGAPVEQYNSLGVLRIISVPDQHEVRCLMGDGQTILRYNHYYNVWSADTNMNANDILSIGSNVYLAPNTTGASYGALVCQENQNSFYDSMVASTTTPVPFNFTTGWINVNDLQGEQHIYSARFLGDLKSAHNLSVGIWYDYESSANETHTISSANIVSSGSAYQCVSILNIYEHIVNKGDILLHTVR